MAPISTEKCKHYVVHMLHSNHAGDSESVSRVRKGDRAYTVIFGWLSRPDVAIGNSQLYHLIKLSTRMTSPCMRR